MPTWHELSKYLEILHSIITIETNKTFEYNTYHKKRKENVANIVYKEKTILEKMKVN